MQHIPDFQSEAPPGIERLESLRHETLPGKSDQPLTIGDFDGVRINALWEAIVLFQKCSHTSLAAQRLGQQGMHSWAMFNAYHSAYLGARGIAEMLGVAVVDLPGRPTILIDLFPETKKPKSGKPMLVSTFSQLTIIPLEQDLDQQGLWETFQRIIRVSTVPCWSLVLHKDLKNVVHTRITPPRNAFLYKALHWPLGDLTKDITPPSMEALVGTELLVDRPGFLLRLCFSVYRLFEQLVLDLAAESAVVKQQLDESRIIASGDLPVISNYRDFVSQISTAGAEQ